MGNGLRLRGLHSIKNRLALLFFSITLAAMAFVYVYVGSSLGSSLRRERLQALEIAANAYSRRLKQWSQQAPREGIERLRREVHAAAESSSYRVTFAEVVEEHVNENPKLDVIPRADSAEAEPASPSPGHPRLRLALEAAHSGRAVTGSVTSGHGPVGQAAKPLLGPHGGVANVVVFSSSLSDVEHSVAALRNRILLAGGIALALSLIAGYLVARALSRRVGRLESAARRVARGDFSARFPVDSSDELGQLASALDTMQRQLAELDRARERFIATASHELRTPIFSLGGFLELIQDEDLDESTRMQFFDQIREQVERLGKLTTGLLDLSRLESGGLELQRTSSDLGEIVEMVGAEFLPALAMHSSELHSELPEESALALCDPERVAQILRIMIDNAIKHTPQGTGIVVSVTPGPEQTRLAVRDHGTGLDPESVERVFEPFFTSGAVHGAGLGLAIAHELAERMGGALEVESSPGRTVFTLVLPTARPLPVPAGQRSR